MIKFQYIISVVFSGMQNSCGEEPGFWRQNTCVQILTLPFTRWEVTEFPSACFFVCKIRIVDLIS